MEGSPGESIPAANAPNQTASAALGAREGEDRDLRPAVEVAAPARSSDRG